MPRVCTSCKHPDREAIDRAMVDGVITRRIAECYGVSETAARRHKSDHLVPLLARSADDEIIVADDLLAQVHMLHARTLRILDTAYAARSMNVALGAVREARGNVELLAKLTSQLSDRPRLVVLIAPEWLQQAHGDRLEAMYALTVWLGLRQGEVFGLRWQDVDFDGS